MKPESERDGERIRDRGDGICSQAKQSEAKQFEHKMCVMS